MAAAMVQRLSRWMLNLEEISGCAPRRGAVYELPLLQIWGLHLASSGPSVARTCGPVGIGGPPWGPWCWLGPW